MGPPFTADAPVGTSAPVAKALTAKQAMTDLRNMAPPPSHRLYWKMSLLHRPSQRPARSNQAADLGREALKIGSEAGSQGLVRISEQAEEHPLATIGVALGVGFLVGVAVCRS
jgi:hypothetical protein